MESLPLDCIRIIAHMLSDTLSSSLIITSEQTTIPITSWFFSHDYFYRTYREEYNKQIINDDSGPSIQVGRLLRQISKTMKTIIDSPNFYSTVFSTFMFGVRSSRLLQDTHLPHIPSVIYSLCRTLILTDEHELGEGFYHMLTLIPNIQYIYLSNIHYLRSIELFLLALHNKQKLNKLHILHCLSINDNVMEQLINILPSNLIDIDLSNCGLQVYPTGSNEDSTINITLPNIETSLSISSSTNIENTASSISNSSILPLTDHTLVYLSQRYATTLTTLRLSSCHYITDSGIITILNNCINLCKLDISCNYLLQGKFLSYLFNEPLCSNLEYLNLSSIGSSKLTMDDCYKNALEAFYPSATSSNDTSHSSSMIPTTHIYNQQEYSSITLDNYSNIHARSSILTVLSKLQYLDISWCPWLHDNLLQSLVMNRLTNCTELKHLSIHACTKLTSKGIQALQQWPGLAYIEHLDIGQLNNLDDNDVAALLSRNKGRHTAITPSTGRSRSNSNTSIHKNDDITNTSNYVSSSSLLSNSINYPSLPYLQYLDISGISHVSIRTFTSIGKHCPNLQRLKCRLNVIINYKCFDAWFTNSSKSLLSNNHIIHNKENSNVWKGFAIMQLTDSDNESDDDDDDNNSNSDITNSDDDDEDDDNYDVSNYRDSSEDYMNTSTADISSFHHPLSGSSSSLSYSSIQLPITHFDFWRCLELDNQSLITISQICPYLTHIDIEGTDVSISDKGICTLIKNCLHLVHINLNSCTTTDRTLYTIAKYNHHLVYLDISGGLEYTNKGLIQLFQSLPLIQVLKLSKLQRINDYNLYYLVKNCKYLRSLTLRGCGMENDVQEWIGINVLGKDKLTNDIDNKDIINYQLITDYFHSPVTTTSDSVNPTTSSNSTTWSPKLLSRTNLTIDGLFLLGQLMLAPNGRLTSLGLSCIPTLTVYHYYIFLRLIIFQSSCSLNILKFIEGITTPNLEYLINVLEKDIPIYFPTSHQSVSSTISSNLPTTTTTTTTGGSSVRMRRYQALSKLEYMIPGVRIEWRG